jgi:hypothetical protein
MPSIDPRAIAAKPSTKKADDSIEKNPAESYSAAVLVIGIKTAKLSTINKAANANLNAATPSGSALQVGPDSRLRTFAVPVPVVENWNGSA